jgi:hypothetical protein
LPLAAVSKVSPNIVPGAVFTGLGIIAVGHTDYFEKLLI